MEWQIEAFEIRPSLWRLIEEIVPESERVEIKEALGEDLVDETVDLQNEVKLVSNSWLGVWGYVTWNNYGIQGHIWPAHAY